MPSITHPRILTLESRSFVCSLSNNKFLNISMDSALEIVKENPLSILPVHQACPKLQNGAAEEEEFVYIWSSKLTARRRRWPTATLDHFALRAFSWVAGHGGAAAASDLWVRRQQQQQKHQGILTSVASGAVKGALRRRPGRYVVQRRGFSEERITAWFVWNSRRIYYIIEFVLCWRDRNAEREGRKEVTWTMRRGTRPLLLREDEGDEGVLWLRTGPSDRLVAVFVATGTLRTGRIATRRSFQVAGNWRWIEGAWRPWGASTVTVALLVFCGNSSKIEGWSKIAGFPARRLIFKRTRLPGLVVYWGSSRVDAVFFSLIWEVFLQIFIHLVRLQCVLVDL